jgi:hypothetical protein
MEKNRIEVGDLVQVAFHTSQMLFIAKGEVLNIPAATGDSWIIRDLKDNRLHYITEGCTISSYSDEQEIP